MLLYASFNKLGFYHLARFTSLCYGEEKKIILVKALQEWYKKQGSVSLGLERWTKTKRLVMVGREYLGALLSKLAWT